MGLGRGWACIGVQFKITLKTSGFGVLAEWGWGGVGHALLQNDRVGPVRAQSGRGGPVRAGWACIGVLQLL